MKNLKNILIAVLFCIIGFLSFQLMKPKKPPFEYGISLCIDNEIEIYSFSSKKTYFVKVENLVETIEKD